MTPGFLLFLVMSVKKVNFHHMTHLRFPSPASKATQEWSDYEDTVDVPSLVMMENMERSGAETIFFAFKDIAPLINLASANEEENGLGPDFYVNSHVVFASMKVKHRPLLPQPLRMTFKHLTTANVTNPTCVHWDERDHGWTKKGCKLLATNATHSECACAHFGMLALLEEVVDTSAEEGLHVTIVVAIIVVVLVLFICVVSAGLGIDYFRKVQVREQTIFKIRSLSCRKKRKYDPTADIFLATPPFILCTFFLLCRTVGNGATLAIRESCRASRRTRPTLRPGTST